MALHYTIRHAVNPKDVTGYDTGRLREAFLLESLFARAAIHLVYTHYDRLIVGGAVPGETPLSLEAIEPLKADVFLERRELGIINIGEAGEVELDGQAYPLEHKEALYAGRGVQTVRFHKSGTGQPVFYLNSAPAHRACPVQKVSPGEAETVELGSGEHANRRTIRKLIVHGQVQTCQLQMGMTELAGGSVWNTMPPHVHGRRMEAYLYFGLPADQVVCHFLGEPGNTRHLWVRNRQAVLSPPWSIHSGCGTSGYSFIWGMAGENLDYADMDPCPATELR